MGLFTTYRPMPIPKLFSREHCYFLGTLLLVEPLARGNGYRGTDSTSLNFLNGSSVGSKGGRGEFLHARFYRTG